MSFPRPFRSLAARLVAVAAGCSLLLGAACSTSAVQPDGPGGDTAGPDTGDQGPAPDQGPDGPGPDTGPDTGPTDGGPDAGPPGLTVTTDKGPVTGKFAGTTRAFFGIPFAAPPTGGLRWKAPQPAAPWDSLDATAKGPVCPQFSPGTTSLSPTSSEDCLQLNVWVPEGDSAPRPVMFWIHGGGFTIGSGADPWYDGQALAEATGNVVVTVNYRLGPLGFLAHDALDAEDASHPVSGNYGLEDQRAAMAWVKTNIAAFGGDPAAVTLFGESAGGTSVCHHLLSPPSADLFAAAIIQSGPCDAEVFSSAPGHAQGDVFAQALECDGEADVLACLRSKDAAAVLTALGSGVLGVSGEDGVWQPVVDGFNLPDHPRVLLDQGQISQNVPVLLGNNRDEGTLFVGAVTDDASYQASVRAMLGEGQLADEVLAEYPSSEFASPQLAAAEVLGDAIFVCTARRMARAFSGKGQTVYRYTFNYVYSNVIFPGGGAFHSAEIPFVFGNPFPGHALTTEEEPLSDAMQGYWGRFAATADPNAEGDALPWPVYAVDTDPVIDFDLKIGTSEGVKTERCDFWDARPLPR